MTSTGGATARGGSGPAASGGSTGGAPAASGGATGSGGATNPDETPGSGGNGSGGAAAPDAGAGTGGSAGDPTPPADAGPSGSTPMTGGDPKPCKFMLCESFEGAEGAAPDPAIWSRQGAPAISTKVAARGKSSLHIPPLTKGTEFIRETKTFPALAKGFYTRMFLWVEREPLEKPAGLYHWTTIEASDNAGGGGRVLRLGGHIESEGTDWLRFNYNTHVNGETGLSDKAAVLMQKKWHCLEAFFDTTGEEARFWLDGQERPMLHWKKNDAKFPFPPDIKSLAFGWAEYQPPQTPFELYIDEIAIDAKPIGCDQ
jgi:hypothetical protein